MCISPHEMSTKELEREIEACYRWAAKENVLGRRDAWEARARNLELILKERAEKGTY